MDEKWGQPNEYATRCRVGFDAQKDIILVWRGTHTMPSLCIISVILILFFYEIYLCFRIERISTIIKRDKCIYFYMGALTLVILIIVILAIIGLGWQVFVSGVFRGAEKIINTNPILKNTTQEAKQYFGGIINNVSEGVIGSKDKTQIG